MKKSSLLLILFTILIIVSFSSLTLGKYPVPVSDILQFFFNNYFNIGSMDSEKAKLLENLIMEIRLPRIFAALMIGASLSVSGATFQAIFVNPLVSPSLLGVLAGASFGAALGMVVAKSWYVVQAFSFVFGFIAVAISVVIAKIHKGNSILLLILGGIISGAFFTSMLSIIKYIADPYNQLPAITQWLMGGLSFSDKQTVLITAFPQAVGIILIIFFSGYINALSMGDDEARSLGVPVEKIRLLLVFLSTLISCVTVVIGGIIGWVGLIIPHICRMIAGPDNKILIPASALIGAAYLVLVDDISRLLFSVEIPIGITTSIIGIPFFVFILKQSRRGWN